MSDFSPAKIVYTAAEVSQFAMEHIKNVQENKLSSISLDIAEIKDYFAPMIPGEVCAVIGQTSHYKSGFLHFWEKTLAEQLMAQGRENEIIVHVSVEETVEEQAFLLLAQHSNETADHLSRGEVQNWNRLTKAAILIGTIPIYRIGDSLARPEDYPNLYLSNLLRAVNYMQVSLLQRPKIAAIFFDYLQAFPIDPEVKSSGLEQQRRLSVRSDMYRLRQAAARFRCPIVVAVQAKQHLEGALSSGWQLPGLYDGEESSSIAQRCDRIISLWLPKMTHPIGAKLEAYGHVITVEENLLIIRFLKQRGGHPSGKIWRCRIDYQKNLIAPELTGGSDGSNDSDRFLCP